MYCVKCGHTMSENSAVCTGFESSGGNGGGAVTKPAASLSAKVRTMKAIIFTAIALLLLVMTFAACGEGNSPDDELSGIFGWIFRGYAIGLPGTPCGRAWSITGVTVEFEFVDGRYTLMQEIGTQTTVIGSNSVWNAPDIVYVPIATEAEIEARIPITFESPARVVSGYRIVSEGTFSVNEDQIEFVNANGDAFVYTFRQSSPDSINIDGILNFTWSQNRYKHRGTGARHLPMLRGFRTARDLDQFADLANPRWR